MEATLEGWVYNATDNTYLLKIGGVTAKHSRQPVWESGYDMFWVSSAEAASIGVLLPEGVTGMWVFDFPLSVNDVSWNRLFVSVESHRRR